MQAEQGSREDVAMRKSSCMAGQPLASHRGSPSSPATCAASSNGYPPKPRPLRHATAAVLAFSLAACQTPPVRDRVVQVSVPIAVQPIKPADVPKLPAPLPKRPANVSSALDLALGKVCEWVAFGIRAQPLLQVSAGLPPLEAPKYPECER